TSCSTPPRSTTAPATPARRRSCPSCAAASTGGWKPRMIRCSVTASRSPPRSRSTIPTGSRRLRSRQGTRNRSSGKADTPRAPGEHQRRPASAILNAATDDVGAAQIPSGYLKRTANACCLPGLLRLEVDRVAGEMALGVDLGELGTTELAAVAVVVLEKIVEQALIHLGQRLVDRQALVLGQHQRLDVRIQHSGVEQVMLGAIELVAECDRAAVLRLAVGDDLHHAQIHPERGCQVLHQAGLV